VSSSSHLSRDLFRRTAKCLHLLLIRLLLLDLFFDEAHIAPENAIRLRGPRRQRFVQLLVSANCIGWRVQPKMNAVNEMQCLIERIFGQAGSLSVLSSDGSAQTTCSTNKLNKRIALK
jgi:hypothetical protein